MTKTILYINIVLSTRRFQAAIKAQLLLQGTKSALFVNNCADILYEERKKEMSVSSILEAGGMNLSTVVSL